MQRRNIQNIFSQPHLRVSTNCAALSRRLSQIAARRLLCKLSCNSKEHTPPAPARAWDHARIGPVGTSPSFSRAAAHKIESSPITDEKAMRANATEKRQSGGHRPPTSRLHLKNSHC
jgi:hypothetical protein